jgi:hypothetical protein
MKKIKIVEENIHNILKDSDNKGVDSNGYTAQEVKNILKAAEGPFESISFEDLCKL